MTYKEAIEILKGYKQRLDVSCSNQLDADKEAFDLAILSLQEFDRMKLICANEGIIVYKVKENQE